MYIILPFLAQSGVAQESIDKAVRITEADAALVPDRVQRRGPVGRRLRQPRVCKVHF